MPYCEFLMMAIATMAIGLIVSLVLLGVSTFTDGDHPGRFPFVRRPRALPPSSKSTMPNLR